MLHPLSYVGLHCPFAQHAGRVLVRQARACYLAPDGLCRVPWANARLLFQRAAPIVRRVMAEHLSSR